MRAFLLLLSIVCAWIPAKSLIVKRPGDLFENGNRNLGRAHISMRGQSSKFGCSGSLHLFDINPEPLLTIIHEANAESKDLKQIKKQSFVEELRGVVQGNCCWVLYPKTFKRGPPTILKPGFDGHLSKFPRSLQTTESCFQRD